MTPLFIKKSDLSLLMTMKMYLFTWRNS